MTIDTNSTRVMGAGYGMGGLGDAGGLGGLTDVPQSAKALTAAEEGDGTGQGGGAGGTSFGDKLRAAKSKKPLSKEESRKIAGDLVANALIMPVMKQIRRDPFGQNTIFSAGTGEKAFGPEFDMQMADRIAHSPRMSVTDALADRLVNRGQPQSQVTFKKAWDESGKVMMPNGVDVHG